jgi:myo-inositol 2-dehydrogenase/D-chiro-inositol 1-dehydrogenase
MATLRIAVIGAGFMGALHARTIVESDVATLAAIVDPAAVAGRAVAERFAVPWAPDVADLGPELGVDAFVVATPDRQHPDIVCPLLEAGRPVLVEKPMAHSLDAARRMADAERKGGARLLVGHILRFDPRYAAAAATVRDGRIGDPIHASSGRLTIAEVGARLGGASSPCFYLGIHDIDALQWISGLDILSVFSRALHAPGDGARNGSPDAVFTTCALSNGGAGQLYCGWTLPASVPTPIWARTEVVGTRGMIDLDVRDHGLRVLSDERWTLPDGLHWPETNGRISGDLCEEIRHFARAVRDDTPFVISTAEAMRAVAVNDAVLRSVESGVSERVADWRAGGGSGG